MASELEELLSEPPREYKSARQQHDQSNGSRESQGTSQSTDEDNMVSKAKRIRDYWEENPGARNMDVAKALEEFGVTTAHVSNAKTQMKLKRKRRKKQPIEIEATSGGKRGRPKSASVHPSAAGKIDVELLDAGVEFLQKAGGMNEALHVLNLIRKIRSL